MSEYFLNNQNYIMESDSFYDQLPFTLPDEQADPQFVVFGTGLQQCLISAYQSKMHLKKGLIIDVDKTYGGCLKTLTIRQLHALSTKKQQQKLYEFNTPQKWLEKNQAFFKHITQQKQFRGYNIDIQPNFFFGSSMTCQLLKQAQMDKYMDFRLVYHLLHYEKDKKIFSEVPLEKSKIFDSKSLGLLEKKTLMMSLRDIVKIFNRYMNIEQDQNSTKQFDKEFFKVNEDLYNQFIDNLDKPFQPLIAKMTKNNKKIINYLTYIVCNYQYNYDKEIPEHAKKQYTVKGFLQRFGKFIKSCKIYGDGPYLYVDNGIGDIPQAFSRIASIFGSLYILHPKINIQSIQLAGDKMEITSNLTPTRAIKTEKIYYGPTFYDIHGTQNSKYDIEHILRVVILAQKLGCQEQCPSIAYILQYSNFSNPVYLYLFDQFSHSCPSNFILYQFQTIIPNKKQSYEEEMNDFIQLLSNIRGQKFADSIKYASCYVRNRLFPKLSTQNSTYETFLKDNNCIDLDGHFMHFREIVGQQQSYFKKQNPNKQEQQEGFDDTNVLLEKLDMININQVDTQKGNLQVGKQKQDNAEQQEGKQVSQQIQTANQEKQKQEKEQKPKEIDMKIEQKQQNIKTQQVVVSQQNNNTQPQNNTQVQSNVEI